ncbi:MAG: TrkA family potassium uptake protein [Clostridia bacterium]|nr:TrkA family potassium uptake protein [Clostridia bacterium]
MCIALILLHEARGNEAGERYEHEQEITDNSHEKALVSADHVCGSEYDAQRGDADKSTVAVRCDLSEEDEIKALGLHNMDIVIVAMSTDLAASILCVSVAKELGVPFVLAKASTPRRATILRRVGADRIIDPEKDSGMRTARVLASPNILEFFDVDENLCLIEMPVQKEWVGRSLKELDLRRRRSLNVIAVRHASSPWIFVDPEHPFSEEETLLVALEKKELHAVQ